jgi:ATP-dependent helicase/nuclease subunit B
MLSPSDLHLFACDDSRYAAAQMPAPSAALQTIARARRDDPLAPATVVAPSHVAAIHLRRQLAEIGPFAGVRFEPLPRIAELLGAAELARQGRSPLARPIGDYLATQIARQARADLADVSDLTGFARVLRQSFVRLRRGGFRPEDVRSSLDSGLLGEVTRLYAAFRSETARFYDEEDLFDAATKVVRSGASPVIGDLGDIYVLPPGALSAGADALLKALRLAAGATHYKHLDTPATTPETAFVLAPDPASEAREVAREVLRTLEAGVSLHEVAVFHGADESYSELVTAALQAAEIPVNASPGPRLSRTVTGKAVLALLAIPDSDYSRTAILDFLELAPLAAAATPDGASTSAWRVLARDAGITRGLNRWSTNLTSLVGDLQQRLEYVGLEDDSRTRLQSELRHAKNLELVIHDLAETLEPLRTPMSARDFIAKFENAFKRYFSSNAIGYKEVLDEIQQLGTIGKIEGVFNLATFGRMLEANLDAKHHRLGEMGKGVLVSRYDLAAGLSFRHVILCGAHEGVFPASVPQEPLVEDQYWTQLRARGHPFLEDAALRQERAQLAAERAVATATERLTWTAPLQAAGAGREHYPAQPMLVAARLHDASLTSATELRRAPASAWLRRPPSPLAAMLTGLPVDLAEARLRGAVIARRERQNTPATHPLGRALELLAKRHGVTFSEFDGNLSSLPGDVLVPSRGVSPTSLEYYAACGMRYYLGSVLRLRPPEEPEDRETIEPRDKGILVHEVLDAFFKRQLERGRPGVNEPWTDADRDELIALLDEELERTRQRGRTGLDVFADHEVRRLRAELTTFLERDTAFRRETGARPVALEQNIPDQDYGGIRLRGIVDRIDATPDGKRAWVLDYKTGSTRPYEGMKDEDPLSGGTKLQLPVYRFAVPDAEEVEAFYWFISSTGGFGTVKFDPSAENMARFEETLRAIIAGVSAGAFPPVPGEEDNRPGFSFQNCAYCDFHRLCSTRRADELQSKLEDRALEAWANVARVAKGESS